ncbi:MAG: NAD(P)/FAD-dependent oxidoreductase [Eggerthellaceae bacterium]|nr:NAD(P)/FAD-dependent oxidoreductase [Eggerthellaceae bacterium]
MAYDYDVIFIGSGHANWHGAVALKAAGKSVAIVEEGTVAGTCTNWGCNAKYLLDTPFDYIDGLEHYAGRGLKANAQVDWHELMEFKKEHITPMYLGMEALFANMGIDLLRGHGKLAGEHAVDVDGTTHTAEFIVIGVGETPNRRDIPGKELLHDSKDFLSIDPFPERVAFIGAGIISLEFASIAAKLGKKATVVHHNDRALKAWPKRFVDKLVAELGADGVEFAFGKNVVRAEQAGDGVLLSFEDGSSLEVDYVVDATGRSPKVAGLGLEDLGIEFSRKGIVVDDHLRTSVANVFATGDCIDKAIPKLTPTAEFESNYVAGQILGETDPICYPATPHLVFTLPRIAQAGVSVNAAEADPSAYRVEYAPFGTQVPFLAKFDAETEFAFVFAQESGALVGAALYGPDAGELINILSMIIDLKLTQADMRKMIFTFPGTAYGLLSTLIPMMA